MDKCVFIKSEGQGTQIYYFKYVEGTVETEEYKFVKVFKKDDEKADFVVICHESKIVPLESDVEIEQKWGGVYLSEASYQKYLDKWSA